MKQKKQGLPRRIPAKETAIFCAQTALLLKAGVPLHEGLDTLTDQGTATGRGLIQQIADAVATTGSLYEAVQGAGVFPAYMVQMIRIGEKVGKLEEVLGALSQYYEREDKLRSAVRSAVLYPLILVIMMAAVIAVLVAAVLPVFSQVLEGLGAEISGAGAGMLSAGTMIGRCSLAVVALLLAVMLALIAMSLTAGGRERLVRLSAKLPFLRGVYRSIASGRFASVMSMMLASGYGLDESLELAEGVTSDPTTIQKIVQCREKVSSGVSFANALLELELFSGLHTRLIQTGERAGRLDDVMRQMAAHYEEEIDDKLAGLVALVEPALVILLSVIIGGILLSVMLPMISILSAIG
ncbi:MAG: type II secretion system F family protein [Clostridiales bacterium]|nr:type II secretion system F family protein [Clostridiales bacterium]